MHSSLTDVWATFGDTQPENLLRTGASEAICVAGGPEVFIFRLEDVIGFASLEEAKGNTGGSI
jgi:hypothetical protein